MSGSATWHARSHLPPDLTRSGGNICIAPGPIHLVCTRGKGHTGRHAAGTGEYVVAVWSDESPAV